MDEILAKASSQAVSFAIRSGISIASGFAIKTMTKFMDSIPDSEKGRLVAKRNSLQRKISALSASFDIIILAAARGNSILEQTVDLVADLKQELDHFDESVAQSEQDLSQLNQKESIAFIDKKMDALTQLINEAIPIINLSLITSGVNLSNVMEPRISPSRLLQAANRINASNIAFNRALRKTEVQVGPTFNLKFYSVFYNPSRLKYIDEEGSAFSKSSSPSSGTGEIVPETIPAISWKEEYANATCTLVRVPNLDFKHKLCIEESFEDGRYHDDDEVAKTRLIDVENIEKQYFSASGRLLRLESSDLPVLVLKYVNNGVAEYVALAELEDDEDSSSDGEELVNSDYENVREDLRKTERMKQKLSLLEYLLRLSALQSNEQCSLLEISDEKLLLYLQDQIDDSMLPKSREYQINAVRKSSKNTNMLQNDSNINRLEKLSLKDE